MLLLVLFGVWSFATALVGAVAGLVLGNLRLPVALLVTRVGPAAAANLVISALTAVASTVQHAREGRVVRRLFLLLAVPSVVGAVLGGLAAGVLPQGAVLAVVAVVLLVSGVQLLRRDPDQQGGAHGEDDGRAGGEHRGLLGATAFGTGLLGGLVGLVLGALRTPVLLRYADDDPKRIAGTNAAVGLAVSVAGTVGHLPGSLPDWGLVVAGCLGGVPGGWLGARLTGRVSPGRLVRGIGGVLVAAAVGTGLQAVTGAG